MKETAAEITPALTLLYQASINQGIIPSDWKEALVVPIFKKGDRNKPVNYRPVSLTVICCKLLEHIVHSSIMTHLDQHLILTDLQHGFRQRRSCDTQLLITADDLIKTIEDGQQTDALLLDFSKAFDKVPHERLLLKLDHYGVRGSVQQWIRHFLQGRTQRVVLGGTKSSTSKVTSGVPQGSVLGPLLFLLFINDLPENLSEGTTARLYADDCLLYRRINNTDDATTLQKDMDTLVNWEQQWLMEFHPAKCQVLRVTKKRKTINAKYTIHGHTLEVVPHAKYLGVTLSHNMSWKQQVDATVKKAQNTLAFLRRNMRHCPEDIKDRCYRTLVRPITEFASCVWDPHTKALITKT